MAVLKQKTAAKCVANLKKDFSGARNTYLSVLQWNKAIFSDECRIERYGSRRTFVRRPINGRFKSKYVLKTVKYGGYSVPSDKVRRNKNVDQVPTYLEFH